MIERILQRVICDHSPIVTQMEHKHGKAYSNILKLLPKSSVVNFQNPLYSPGREKRSDPHHHHHHMNKTKTHIGKGFSGPMMSMSLVPADARTRNLKNNNHQSLANQEPTSPKISCMGQIKHKHKQRQKFDKAKSFSVAKEEKRNTSKVFSPKQVKKHPSMLKRMFTMSKSTAPRKSFDQADNHDERRSLPDRAPGLSQMKRFASGRDAFSSFDWTAQQIAPETDRGAYYSYEERGDSDEEQDEDRVIIPFSAPIAVVKGVALQPRKEVNLWKRRPMNPPAPLQLNSTLS